MIKQWPTIATQLLQRQSLPRLAANNAQLVPRRCNSPPPRPPPTSLLISSRCSPTAAHSQLPLFGMAKKGYYAVAKGRVTGVFETWEECEQQVKGVSGPVFKKFKTREEANAFVSDNGCAGQGGGYRNEQSDPVGSGLSSGGGTGEAGRLGRDDGGFTFTPPPPIDFDPLSQDGFTPADVKSFTKDGRAFAADAESGSNNSRTFVEDRKPLGSKDGRSTTTDGSSGALTTLDAFAARIASSPTFNEYVSKRRKRSSGHVSSDESLDDASKRARTSASSATPSPSSSEQDTTDKRKRPRVERPARTDGSECVAAPEEASGAASLAAPAIPPAPLASSSTPSVIHVYCDGAATKNGQRGAQAGYGVWFADEGPLSSLNESKRLPGSIQSNNRAELMAAIRAVQIAPKSGQLVIHTDSRYTIDAVTGWINGWRQKKWKTAAGNKVLNRDLIRRLDLELRTRPIRPTLQYVRGHSGVYGNEMADLLAVHGAAMPVVPPSKDDDLEPPPSDDDEGARQSLRRTQSSSQDTIAAAAKAWEQAGFSKEAALRKALNAAALGNAARTV